MVRILRAGRRDVSASGLPSGRPTEALSPCGRVSQGSVSAPVRGRPAGGGPVGGPAGSRCGKPRPRPQPTRHGSQGEDTAPGPDGPRRPVCAPFLTCASPAAATRQQLEDTEAAGTFQKRPVLEDEVEVSKQRRGAGRK